MSVLKPDLKKFVSESHLNTLIKLAMDEDLGPDRVDVTSAATIEASATGRAAMISRARGTISGLTLLERITRSYDPAITVTLEKNDSDVISPGETVAHLTGPLRSLLAVERVALNFTSALSGIATLTRQFVEAVADTNARIYDTRKTLPGFRGLAKYAVACGGGQTHRHGLFDAVLVKDNHLAHTPMAELPGTMAQIKKDGQAVEFIQIEVDTLDQLQAVLPMPIDRVLLDNMPPEVLMKAVAMRDEHAPHVELEASGGVNLQTVQAIANTGIDRISIGALTHSAPALDLGLDFD